MGLPTMLNILGQSNHACDGITRRSLLSAACGLALGSPLLSAKPQAAMRNATINLIFLAAVMPVMGVCKDRILAIASCDEVGNQIEHFLA